MRHRHEKCCRVVICQRPDRCCATRTGVCSHWFLLCIGQILRSRPALGLCMTCLSNTFSDRRLSLSRTIVLAVFALVLALRLHTDLLWHKIAVSVLSSSRDLEDFLSHLYPARDPCVFTDEARLDSPILHPHRIHMMSSITVSDD